MTDASQPQTGGRRRWRPFDFPTEFIAAAVLGLAGLLSSWATYQASLWDGDQAAAYSRANATRTTAALAGTRAGQFAAIDVFLFSQWLDAYAAKDANRQTFYRLRFRPEFEAAFIPWRACEESGDRNCPKTPVVMPQYKLAAADEAARLQAEADALYAEGQSANEVSDEFVRTSVIMATALFFAGICQVFKTRHVRVGLVAIAVLACAVGVSQLIGLPLNGA